MFLKFLPMFIKKEALDVFNDRSKQTEPTSRTFENKIDKSRYDKNISDEQFSIIKKAYESSRAASSIKSIEICCIPEGECRIEIVNNKAELTIKIPDTKCSYDFVEVFIHELYHAENYYDVDILRNGKHMYCIIKENLIAYLGFYAFTEYYACRKTAENHKMLNTPEKIKQVVDLLKFYIDKDKIISEKNICANVLYLHYKLSTLSAFAEASHDDKWITIDDLNYYVVEYIITYKNMLNISFESNIYEENEYYELGNQLMISLKNCLINFSRR